MGRDERTSLTFLPPLSFPVFFFKVGSFAIGLGPVPFIISLSLFLTLSLLRRLPPTRPPLDTLSPSSFSPFSSSISLSLRARPTTRPILSLVALSPRQLPLQPCYRSSLPPRSTRPLLPETNARGSRAKGGRRNGVLPLCWVFNFGWVGVGKGVEEWLNRGVETDRKREEGRVSVRGLGWEGAARCTSFVSNQEPSNT